MLRMEQGHIRECPEAVSERVSFGIGTVSEEQTERKCGAFVGGAVRENQGG